MKLNRKLIRKMILKEMADMGMGMAPQPAPIDPAVVATIRELVGTLKYLVGQRLAAPGTDILANRLDSMGHKLNSGQLQPAELLRFLNSPQGMPVQRSRKIDAMFNKLKILLQNSL